MTTRKDKTANKSANTPAAKATVKEAGGTSGVKQTISPTKKTVTPKTKLQANAVPKTAREAKVVVKEAPVLKATTDKSVQQGHTAKRKVVAKAAPALSKAAVRGTETAQRGLDANVPQSESPLEFLPHSSHELSSHSEGYEVMLSETQQPIADPVSDLPTGQEIEATSVASTEGGQDEIDSRNSSFWDELCGTHLASSLGVVDNGKESLALFDKWFFDIYPYLDKHLDLPSLKGKRVLEIGLGYGTVGQYLAEHCEEYMGLDIAAGPVNMMRHRMQQNGLNGDATQGSILDAPFPDQSFDVIVALGCLHHSGDLQRAFSECRRLLKPGGRLTLMVYYAFSYRRFEHQFAETWDYLGKELMGYRGVIGVTDAAARAAADTNAKGEAAPHTDWVGAASLKTMLKRAGFKGPKTTLENIDQAGPFVKVPREDALKSRWPAIWGLDIYASAWAN